MNKQKAGIPNKRRVGHSLASEITRRASKQTYYTFRLLVAPERVEDALRAYAYFRWVDDELDCNTGTQAEKLAFINRQRYLMDAFFHQEPCTVGGLEEQMLVDILGNDHNQTSGLHIYLRNMMDVMSFDVQRKGQLITQAELSRYSDLLSIAVTELLFYVLDADDPSPHNEERSQAVRGAHIVHMLRDMLEDINLGYINIPSETLHAGQIALGQVNSQPFIDWVAERVALAHQCFSAGRRYFARVKSFRCRLAACAYLARFEWVLQAIERDGYRLRHEYPERKGLGACVWMAWRVIRSLVNKRWLENSAGQVAFPD
jgi:phytoene/squalene synthetase